MRVFSNSFGHRCTLDRSWAVEEAQEQVDWDTPVSKTPIGPARDYANGDTSVYPGSGPPRVEVKPLLPACFVLSRQQRLQCSLSCSG
jgi:hypothetical protein